MRHLLIQTLFVFTLFSCNHKILENAHEIDLNEFAEQAITDFYRLDTLIDKGDVFYVKIKNLNKKVVGVSIILSSYKILISNKDVMGSKGLAPSRAKIYNDKLFYWRDDAYPLTESVLNTFQDYEIVDFDSTGVRVVPEATGRYSQFGAGYYFCRYDVSNYKRVVTGSVLNASDIPKFNCRNRWHK